MRLAAALRGELAKDIEEEMRLAERAAGAAMGEFATGLQSDYRRQTEQAGLGSGTARAWRQRLFPRNGQSLGAAALVWSRAPNIIQGFNEGALITPSRDGVKYLAIPTSFNRTQGRRRSLRERRAGVWANVRVTPAEMVAASKFTFLRPRDDGPGFLWMMQVTRGQLRGKNGRISERAYAGGNFLLGGGRRARTREALEHGAVPMFVLIPQVRLEKKLDLEGAADKRIAQVPDALLAHWK